MSLFQPLLYYSLHRAFRLGACGLFRYHCQGRHWLPAQGGGLLCANHQSMLDPILVGIACDRQCTFLARKTLFDSPFFRGLITTLNAVPIDREGFSLQGIKETIRRLRKGELVVVFPEGTRTKDGNMQSLKPGICAIARRGHVPLVPIGLDGAFQALPRRSLLPQLRNIHVTIGEPISTEEIAATGDDGLLVELEGRMRQCFDNSRRVTGHARRHVAPVARPGKRDLAAIHRPAPPRPE